MSKNIENEVVIIDSDKETHINREVRKLNKDGYEVVSITPTTDQGYTTGVILLTKKIKD